VVLNYSIDRSGIYWLSLASSQNLALENGICGVVHEKAGALLGYDEKSSCVPDGFEDADVRFAFRVTLWKP
jgi:hypothetical protein